MLDPYLTASDKAELSRLLDEALELSPTERAQWLAALAAEFAALKPHLEAILSRDDVLDSATFMAELPSFSIPSESVDDPSQQPGRVIGPYRLERELGTGGMGSVWLATRSDGLISRPVALKLPHSVWRRADLPERLAREREILSTLNHPHIARLYDAGIAADGQPYLALELVEGMPIDKYCAERDIGIRGRLKLIVQVARAAAYAHGKLIVHRDLKPANILVTEAGEVRLLDFGIAKLLGPDSATQAQLTEMSGHALTPDYASPEQIRGELLTVGSDVYSLGVLLFELLTGARPYRLKRASRGALEDAILQVEPKRPSEVAPVAWRKRLRGDLDTIALKALKKDSRERYATADAFADDIERHLASQPVQARPDSTTYRFGRFVVRNKIPVAAATVAAVALVTGTGVVLWQSQLVRAEQRRAEQARDFIADVFRQADPASSTGRVYSAADLLRQAERRLQQTPDEDPRLHLELLDIIGESMFGLQQHDDSVRVLQQALKLQQAQGVKDDALSARLHLGLSRSYELLGRSQEAKAEIERALQILNANGNTQSTLFAQAKVQQAAMGIVLADYVVAEQAALDAITAAKSAQGKDAPEVATALQQLSHVFTLTQRRQEAVLPARQAFELLRRLHAGDLAHPKLLEAAMYFAQSQHSAGDFEAASALYSDAVSRAAQVFGADSRVVGELLTAQISAETDRGNLDTAVRIARQSLAILAEAERGSRIHGNGVRLLGTALLAARKFPEAELRLAEAVDLTVAAKTNLEAAHSRLNLGLALAHSEKFSEAQAVLEKVLDKPVASASRAQHLAMRNMGTLLRLQGRHEEALRWLDASIEGASIQPSHRGDLAHGLLEAGRARLALGEIEAAEKMLSRAKELFADVQRDRMTPARADLLVALGQLAMARNDCSSAAASLEQAHRYWQEYEPKSRWAAEAEALLRECRRGPGPSP
jgi:serine/threonine-protein kinase